jgi:hypothetical protein
MIRTPSVLALGLLLLGCGGLPFGSGSLPSGSDGGTFEPPLPRVAPATPSGPSPRGAEREGFPTGPIEDLCGGRSAAKYRRLPEAQVDALFTELRPLDRSELEARVCATDVRQEVAVAFTLLAAHSPDTRTLRIAADTYAEPVALATLGALYATGSRGLPKDDGAANRYRLASAVIARGVGQRTSSDALAKRANKASGDAAMAGGGENSIGAPDRDTVATIQSFVDARVERYEELYLGRDRRTARR